MYPDTAQAAVARLAAPIPARWSLRLVTAAGEAGGCFLPSRPQRRSFGVRGAAQDPERAAIEASRRARRNVRVYCAANGLNRLGTLTYRGVGCHDPAQLRVDVAGFFRRLRAAVGNRPFPYLWVAEWHQSGHGLHVHFSVGRFIKRSVIERAWGHGFVHIKLLGGLPVGSSRWDEARLAARYLSKYVAKTFHPDTRRVFGRHRYEVAQGFQPVAEAIHGTSRADVITRACERMQSAPSRVWLSSQDDGWCGPPALWVSW